MKKTENITVGISIGDLSGVGSEVVLKTFEDSRMLELCTPVIFANVKFLSSVKKTFESNSMLHGIDSLSQVVSGKINVYNTWKEVVEPKFGLKDDNAGKYAVESLTAATNALKEGLVDVLVTAPIDKFNAQSDQFKFTGHTDYLGQEFGASPLMLMVHDNLRVGLLTDHVPVSEISKFITADLLSQKIETIKNTLIQDFGIRKPKIAVLGLNPHSGDHGVIGKEDEEIIKPVVRSLFERGTMVFGPFSADGFFGSNQYESYDAILAMYHDQGLIPFKTLSFGRGVNFTAGLSKVRTSPDHGTAYDIAGKGIADHNSFKEAVYLAIDIYRSRIQHEEITKNPMKVKEKQLERNNR